MERLRSFFRRQEFFNKCVGQFKFTSALISLSWVSDES